MFYLQSSIAIEWNYVWAYWIHSILSHIITSPFVFLFSSICNNVVQKIPRQIWVGIGSVAIIAGSAYPVFSKDVRPGHEYFSSEKPEVVLLAQEAKHKEYTQQLKERRAQLKADQEKSSKL